MRFPHDQSFGLEKENVYIFQLNIWYLPPSALSRQVTNVLFEQ